MTEKPKRSLSHTQLEEVSEELAEFSAGYAGFLSWTRGEIDLEDEATGLEELPWRAPFLLFAGRGRVRVYRKILEDHGFEIDAFNMSVIEQTEIELEDWLKESYNETAGKLEEAYPEVLRVYRDGYGLDPGHPMRWDFDDFIEERDLIEFFLIGVGEQFPTTDLAVPLFRIDCEVRERIAELGLENFEEEFFDGRVRWYPQRFWWHHPPEERVPHPDSLET